jgi:uncharacterized protein (DUF697 family)
MTGSDLAMVVQVKSIYDVHLDKAQAAAIFTTIAAPLIGS